MNRIGMTTLVALVAGCAMMKAEEKPASNGAAPEASASGLRIAVKPLKGSGIDAAATGTLEGQICTALFNAHADAICPDDLKAIISVKQQQMELGGCDASDADCMQKIAGVANANRVLIGEVGKIDGGGVVITLSMVDTTASRVVGRASERVGSLGDLPAKLPEMVNQLLK